MIDRMFGIQWAEWDNITIIVPILIAIITTIIFRSIQQVQYIQRMASPTHQRQVLTNTSTLRRVVKSVLYVVSCCCISVALLRPQWGQTQQSVTQEGRDIVVALDISRSMLAQDVTPDRLSCAKHKIQSLVDNLGADRVALVMFAGDAVVQCPLTRDRSAFQLFLDGINSETITSGTTAIQSALQKAADVFSSRDIGNRQKLLVVLTDGEDFGSHQQQMRDVLKQEGLHLFIMSVGTQEGAPVPEYDANGNHTGYKRDKNGNIAISRCDTQLARDLATSCNGVYVQARGDDADVTRICQWVNYFEKMAEHEMAYTGYEERYYIYTVPALISICLEWLI